MPFSTNTELFNNVKIIESSFETSPTPAEFATERIALADKMVQVDAGKYVDFSLVPDDATTPVINLLSQYKAAEMALRRITGIKRRTQENDDIAEWESYYNKLLDQLKKGDLNAELEDGTNVGSSVGRFENTARPDIKPNQGYDKYGEWLDNDDMEDLQGTVGE